MLSLFLLDPHACWLVWRLLAVGWLVAGGWLVGLVLGFWDGCVGGMRGRKLFNGSFVECVRKLVSTEGVRSLYRGLVPSLAREASYSSLRIGLYEPVKNLCVRACLRVSAVVRLFEFVVSRCCVLGGFSRLLPMLEQGMIVVMTTTLTMMRTG